MYFSCQNRNWIKPLFRITSVCLVNVISKDLVYRLIFHSLSYGKNMNFVAGLLIWLIRTLRPNSAYGFVSKHLKLMNVASMSSHSDEQDVRSFVGKYARKILLYILCFFTLFMVHVKLFSESSCFCFWSIQARFK